MKTGIYYNPNDANANDELFELLTQPEHGHQETDDLRGAHSDTHLIVFGSIGTDTYTAMMDQLGTTNRMVRGTLFLTNPPNLDNVGQKMLDLAAVTGRIVIHNTHYPYRIEEKKDQINFVSQDPSKPAFRWVDKDGNIKDLNTHSITNNPYSNLKLTALASHNRKSASCPSLHSPTNYQEIIESTNTQRDAGPRKFGFGT